jgi:hypothetical protein
MVELDPSYVLAPFDNLIGNCHNNVLMGLRLAEKTDAFPQPTPEESKFIQFSIGTQTANMSGRKVLFRKWVLIKGFEDIHKCIRTTLERLFIFKSLEKEIATIEPSNLHKLGKELNTKAKNYKYPQLMKEVNSLLDMPLQYGKYFDSFNNARNCLSHDDGVITARRCNNDKKDKLVIVGQRLKLFFQNGDDQIEAEIGKPGPENAALILGAEEFKLEFSVGQSLEISLKQFTDILHTCIFISNHIGMKLQKKSAVE